MSLERRHQTLLPRKQFLARQARYALGAILLVTASLGVGMLGYHHFGHLDWVDSLLNASFILTGMGPVDAMTTVPGKLFASGYAIFSGIAFLSTIGLLMTPLAHRFLHRFHVESGRDGHSER
ncbi:MAG TPA: hypothetical protein VKW04_23420 [Planctomycetota bacterium]|nr:hypothetical protein [Planctomycetota bacterium]